MCLTFATSPHPQQLPAPLAVTQLDEGSRRDDLESDRPISLTLSEPVDIKDVLFLLVRDTNLSLVPDPDVEGSFTGELKNVTVRQAFEIVLQPLGLDYSVQGDVIRVFRRRMVTRIFDINYVITRRVTIADGPTRASSVQVSSPDSGDLFGEIEIGVRTLLSREARYNLDRTAGILQVTDYPEILDRVRTYVAAVQTRVNLQVLIEAKVIEVELPASARAGIDWTAVLHRAGNAASLTQTLAPSTPSGFTAGVDVKDLDGLLSALATQGKVKLIASPHVIAMNNQPALMKVGIQDVFFTTTTQVDGGSGRLLQTSIRPTQLTEGVVLSVTPHIGSDGVIHVSLNPSVTERAGQARSRLGDTVPVISVRETDTQVRISPGETVIISGLLQDRVMAEITTVPVLGRVPLVGGLFRREEHIRRKTDLVVLLKPTIRK